MGFISTLTLNLYCRFRNLILYGIIGALSASFDFLLFYFLTTTLNVYYLFANVFSVTCGICLSFFLNREYNFKVKNKFIKRLTIFFSIGFFGLIISSGLLYTFVVFLQFEKVLSKLLSIILVVLMQFLLNKFITFKKDLK